MTTLLQLVTQLLDLLDGGEHIQNEDFLVLIGNWSAYPEFNSDLLLNDIMEIKSYIWEVANVKFVSFKDDTLISENFSSWLVNLCQYLQVENDHDDASLAYSMLLIVYQLIKISLLSRHYLHSEGLITTILSLLDTNKDSLVDKFLCLLISELAELGLTSSQLLSFYNHLSKPEYENYLQLFYSLFTNENYINNSFIFHDFEEQLTYPNLSLKNTRSCFILSSWIKLSSSLDYTNIDKPFDDFTIFQLTHPNGSLLINYSIRNGRLYVSTSTEEQLFACFQFEVGKLYNISFAHVCEGKKMIRLDLFINGILIESKIILTIFGQYNQTNNLFSTNDSRSILFDFSITGPNRQDNIVLEITNTSIIETTNYIEWISYIKSIGPIYSGTFADSDIKSLITSTKLIDLYLTTNGHMVANDAHVPFKISSDEVIFISTFNSNSKDTSTVSYHYKLRNKLVKSETSCHNLIKKEGISLLNTFDSLGSSVICLQLIENATSAKDLITNVSFLFHLLKSYKPIELNFINNCGFEILSFLLKSKTDILTIDILDCILRFVGYDVLQPSESIIKNCLVYKALILNFEIWQCSSVTKNKIVNKFLLFQFTVFAQESKYAKYNVKQISDMKIVKKILIALKRNDFHEDVIPVVRDILWVMIKYNYSPEIFRLLQLHVIFSINKPEKLQHLGGEQILEIIENVITEYPKVMNAISFKFLLSVMGGSLKMRITGLDIIIKFIFQNTKSYGNFLTADGFSILTNYLKSDWDNDDILLSLLSSIFQDPTTKRNFSNILDLSNSLTDENIRNGQYKHLFGVLNNLMKFAAFDLSSRSESVLLTYVKTLKVLKNNEIFVKKILNSEDLIGNIIYLTLVIKQNQSANVYREYNTFLVNYLIDRLYLDETNDILTLIENIYRYYSAEFNHIIIPLLFEKLNAFESLTNLTFSNLNKSITLCKILIFYFQTITDIKTDNFVLLKNIENSVPIISDLLKIRETQTRLIPFVNTLIREFNQSYISVIMYYINNIEDLTNNDRFEKLKYCCQIFMSHLDIITKYMNDQTFFTLLLCLFQTLNLDPELLSLSLNCIRVSLLGKPNFQNFVKSLPTEERTQENLEDLFQDILSLNDEQILQILKINKDMGRYLTDEYMQRFGIYSKLPLFDLNKKSIDEYINEKINLEKSTKKIESDLKPFNKLIFNEELKVLNSNIQDEIDDYCYYFNLFETIKGNLGYSSIPTHKVLYSTEGKNRKRNKLINIISDEAYEIFKRDDIQKESSRLRRLSDNMTSKNIEYDADIDNFKIISKLDTLEDEFDEDRNRRILRNLFVDDKIHEVYNVTQIVGLDAKESILILGSDHIYIVEGYFFNTHNGEFCCNHEAPDDQRDELVKLLMELNINKKENTTNNTSIKIHNSKSWKLSSLVSISKRKFLLRDTAFELFFQNGSSSLLTCSTNSKRNRIFNKLNPNIVCKLKDKNFKEALKLSSQQKLQTDKVKSFNLVDSLLSNSSDILSSNITAKWCNGEISNFQYLMLLNTIAGRTFNDLTQYPVFPFVLSDYTSETIDLNDPSVYRDLAKPMGAQNSNREQLFKDRYAATKEMSSDTPPFHYGTHYSSAMIVTSYLIRFHPFTENYLKLQGGKFDHSDRLFYSISKLWNSASKENTTDVRELIPEFYYLPEFLINSNNFQFGKLQDGSEVNNVELPSWSNDDVNAFIRIMRDALESDYVSSNLPEWIDLIFGYKQQGIEAINSTNVFHYLSYPGSVDLEKIHDEHERAVIISIIHNFGQSPLQILNKKHPMKNINFKLDSLNIKNIFLNNFKNSIVKDDEKLISKWNQGKDIDEIIYDEENKKWISNFKNVKFYPGLNNHELRIEQIGINCILINEIYTFEELIIGGGITNIKVLTKDKFVIGFNNGILKIFEFCKDKFRYITNAQRSIIKFESNNNKNIKNLFRSDDSNNDYILLEIGNLLNGHEHEISKIEYLENDGILITLDSKGESLTIWHEPNKLESKNGEIFKMNQIQNDDFHKIIDFDLIEDDNLIYLVNELCELIIFRINGSVPIYREKIDFNVGNIQWIKICQNYTENDYNHGTLFLLKYDDEKYSVFYLSRDLKDFEKLKDLELGFNDGDDDVRDLKFGYFKNNKVMIVLGCNEKIIFIE